MPRDATKCLCVGRRQSIAPLTHAETEFDESHVRFRDAATLVGSTSLEDTMRVAQFMQRLLEDTIRVACRRWRRP